MDLWLVAFERDIADQGQDLDLLAHRDALVVLLLPVEVAELGLAERADRGEARCADRALVGEARQAGDRILAGGENDGERVAVECFGFHAPSRSRLHARRAT